MEVVPPLLAHPLGRLSKSVYVTAPL